MTALVVVPMHNEAAVVADVITSLRAHFPHVVCVDDGSGDGSGDLARAAGATVLRHAVNLGQGAALQTGFEYALTRTDVEHVITFDADGQHDVQDAVAMLGAARATGVDVVLGSRRHQRQPGQPLVKKLVLRAGLLISRTLSGLDLTDTHNGLRVVNRRALSCLTLRQRGMAHASEIESLIGRHELSWIERPITVTYSDYSIRKGQSSLNAFNVLYDLVAARLTTP